MFFGWEYVLSSDVIFLFASIAYYLEINIKSRHHFQSDPYTSLVYYRPSESDENSTLLHQPLFWDFFYIITADDNRVVTCTLSFSCVGTFLLRNTVGRVYRNNVFVLFLFFSPRIYSIQVALFVSSYTWQCLPWTKLKTVNCKHTEPSTQFNPVESTLNSRSCSSPGRS